MPLRTDFILSLTECDEKSVGKGLPPHWQEADTEYTSKDIKDRAKKNIVFGASSVGLWVMYGSINRIE